ncbi:MAG: acyl-ACP--UDP-N-acetylglucosamine O-acyltransferase [Gammaproteobacteria bacterium]
MSIHETAIVDKDARIHDDVEIGPYSIIGPGVEIGAGTRVGAHVVIRGPTRLGRDNRIFSFASIGEDPQDKKYAGEETRLEIGDRNTIRECCTINRGTAQDVGVTRLGDDNWLMAYVHVAHDCQVGSNVIMANGATLAGHVHVGDWVIFAGFSGAHQFCRIGPHCFLGMYAGVAKDVPAYVMVTGQPPEPRGINAEGLKRRGFTPEQIRNVREAYRILYRSGEKLADALDTLTELSKTQPELVPMVESIRSSERSIIR